jgi:2-amino-4-hydroxy-6-hydroxymethyldihydropteridine diphosphokinase
VRIVYLSLGSNIGHREEALQAAVDKLNSREFRIRRVSSVYETAPVDKLNQPDFLNVVLEAESDLMPMRLLHRIGNIEREMGRKRLTAKGPRIIDIDILLYGPFVINTRQLQIPHPRMTERRFVLQPLAEVAPELKHPVSRQSVRDLLAAAPQQFVRKTTIRLMLPGSRPGS